MGHDNHSNPDWETIDPTHDEWRWGTLTYLMYEQDTPTSVEGYLIEELIGNPQQATRLKVRCVTPHQTIVVPWRRVCELTYTDDGPA